MHRGHVKLFRKIRDHWIFQDADDFRAWIIILMEVNHTPCKSKIGNKIVECGRGESLYSLDTWASKFGKGWNKSKVNRFFRVLQNDSMIVLKSETQTTRLTVQNYSLYHDSCNADETQVKRRRNASETQTKPIEECKEGKNEKKETKDTFVFLLPDWIPQDKWEQWLEVRKKKKSTPTEHAKDLASKKIADLMKLGHTATEILDAAILGSWTGIYPPPMSGKNKPSQQKDFTPSYFKPAPDPRKPI